MFQSQNLNKKYSITFVLIFLIVSSPFTLAQTSNEKKEIGKEETEGFLSVTLPEEEFKEGQVTDINILVNRYEPTTLTTDIIEEQNVPIYAFLSATPTGTAAELELPRIQKVTITEVKGNKSSTTGVRYYEPKIWSWQDIGYLELRLRKIEKEHKVPEKIEVDLKARIEYEADITSSILGGAQTLTLRETPVTSLQEVIFDPSADIFGGKAHIVLRRVDSNSAIFSIYDSEGKFITNTQVALGLDSQPINIIKTANVPESNIRIRLNKIIDESKPNAVVVIDNLEHSLVKGTRILDWKVDEIKVLANEGYIKLSKEGIFGGEVYLFIGKPGENLNKVYSDISLLKGKFHEINQALYNKLDVEENKRPDEQTEYKKLKENFEKLQRDWGTDFDVKKINAGSKPKAVFRVGGQEKLVEVEEGQKITDGIFQCQDLKEKNICKLEQISGARVLVSHPELILGTTASGQKQPCTIKTKALTLRNLDRRYLTEELTLPVESFIDTLSSSECREQVILEEIKTNRAVEVTILSGRTRGVTETEFSLNIPIAKRAIKLSPRSLDNKINSTQELIDKLTKTINKLEKVVESWSKICLATTAVFTIYNFVFGYGIGDETEKVTKKPEDIFKDSITASGLKADTTGSVCNDKGKDKFKKLTKKDDIFYDSPLKDNSGKLIGNIIFVSTTGLPQFFFIEKGNVCEAIQNSVIYDKDSKMYTFNIETGLIEESRGLNLDQLDEVTPFRDYQKEKTGLIVPIRSEDLLKTSAVIWKQYTKKWKIEHGPASDSYYFVYYQDSYVDVMKGIGKIDLTTEPKEQNDRRINQYTKDSAERQIYLEIERLIVQRVGAAQKRGLSQVDLFGEKYKLATNKELNPTKIRCEEVLGPAQCKLMYNACDPVMCPASRCNLGGNYKVPNDNVIQSGLLGSLVLCLPNFIGAKGDVIVPICLTGILASLKNIKSYLETYKSCLITAKAEDKAVGICDKIRSIFMCEIIWKEAITILNTKGGILNFIFNLGSGGSDINDYFNLKERVQGLKRTVDFFTQSYATTIFSAYKGKTTEQIGAEVCKSAVGGAFPNLGDFVSEISQPEDPPQFTAYFEEHDYSPTLGISKYDVYYHVYAGTPRQSAPQQILNYQVFLQTQGLPDLQIARGNLKKGEFADASLSPRGPRGHQQICVSLNGKVQCGFGKTVSTSFGINQLANKYIAENLASEITKAEDCVPSQQSPLTSYSAGFIPTAAVQRICSLSNPYRGLGAEKESEWYIIGNCGIDEKGSSLGKCWEHANLEIYPEIQAQVFKDSCEENQNAELCQVNERCVDGAVLREFEIRERQPGIGKPQPLLTQAFEDQEQTLGKRQCCTGTCEPINKEIDKKIDDATNSFDEASPKAKEAVEKINKKGFFTEADFSGLVNALGKNFDKYSAKYHYILALNYIRSRDYKFALSELSSIDLIITKEKVQNENIELVLKGLKELITSFALDYKILNDNEVKNILEKITKQEQTSKPSGGIHQDDISNIDKIKTKIRDIISTKILTPQTLSACLRIKEIVEAQEMLRKLEEERKIINLEIIGEQREEELRQQIESLRLSLERSKFKKEFKELIESLTPNFGLSEIERKLREEIEKLKLDEKGICFLEYTKEKAISTTPRILQGESISSIIKYTKTYQPVDGTVDVYTIFLRYGEPSKWQVSSDGEVFEPVSTLSQKKILTVFKPFTFEISQLDAVNKIEASETRWINGLSEIYKEAIYSEGKVSYLSSSGSYVEVYSLNKILDEAKGTLSFS